MNTTPTNRWEDHVLYFCNVMFNGTPKCIDTILRQYIYKKTLSNLPFFVTDLPIPWMILGFPMSRNHGIFKTWFNAKLRIRIFSFYLICVFSKNNKAIYSAFPGSDPTLEELPSSVLSFHWERHHISRRIEEIHLLASLTSLTSHATRWPGETFETAPTDSTLRRWIPMAPNNSLQGTK